MRRVVIALALVAFGIVAILWLTGGVARWSHALTEAQRWAQDQLAEGVRALRAHAPGALAGLMGLCFTYGVLHAAGPGHGKMLIGGYALARRVSLGRVIGLALAASLAQAGVAIALVYATVYLLSWTRTAIVGASEDYLTPVGTLLVAGLGLWLALRGVRALYRQVPPRIAPQPSLAVPDLRRAIDGHGHGHHHHHPKHAHDGHDHADCGHVHGPSLKEIAEVASWRDAALLVAGVALRPCTGALFLLILTWQLGIGAAGIAGALAMGLGTAAVTSAAAGLAVWSRQGVLSHLSDGRGALVLPVLELTVGALILLVAANQIWSFAGL